MHSRVLKRRGHTGGRLAVRLGHEQCKQGSERQQPATLRVPSAAHGCCLGNCCLRVSDRSVGALPFVPLLALEWLMCEDRSSPGLNRLAVAGTHLSPPAMSPGLPVAATELVDSAMR